jgi:Zn-dependent protease with chaperone function
MTANTPMSGKDTAAAFKGLVIGLVALAVIVLVIVNLTNRKFESHAAPAATSTP